MNNNKISNPKLEVPKGITLNDKDYATSLLTCLKELEKNYTIVLTEASNEYLYSVYKNIFENITSLQRKTYETMFKLGWYQIEKADATKISEKYNTLSNEYTSLN